MLERILKISLYIQVVQALESIGVRNPKHVAMKAHELGSVPIPHKDPTSAFESLRSKLFVSLRQSSSFQIEQTLFDLLLKYLISKSTSFRRDIAASLIKAVSSFTAGEDSEEEDSSPLKKLRVKEIKARLDKLHVDYSTCVEKKDLISLLSTSLSTSKSDDLNIERLRVFVTEKIIKNDDVEPSFRREIYRSAMCRIKQMPQGVARFSLIQHLLDTCRMCRPEDEAIILAMIPNGMGSDVYVMLEYLSYVSSRG